MATREQTLVATFAAMEALHAYSAFNPSIMTIRKFALRPFAPEDLIAARSDRVASSV